MVKLFGNSFWLTFTKILSFRLFSAADVYNQFGPQFPMAGGPLPNMPFQSFFPQNGPFTGKTIYKHFLNRLYPI
jgi:hypothetical protein